MKVSNSCRFPEYLSNGEPKGDLLRHIELVLDEWNILHDCYINQVTRVLNSVLSQKVDADYIDKIIKLMLILHDYGKLAEAYINTRGYLHEILGSYIALKINAEEILKRIVSSAIFLHHEHRIYRAISYNRTAGLNISVILFLLGRFPERIRIQTNANECLWRVIKRENIENLLGKNILKDEYEKSELQKGLMELMKLEQRGGYKLYFAVGLLNHILVICDIRAAYKSREDQSKRLSKYFNIVINGGRLCKRKRMYL